MISARLSRSILLLSLSLSLGRCAGAGNAQHAADRYWNDLAHYLAGMAVSDNSAFAALQRDDSYRSYSQLQDRLWARIAERSHNPISAWRAQYAPRNSADSLLYLFSGADVANLLRWYPEADRYVMVSLEEPGEIPDPRTLSAAERQAALVRLHNSIVSLGNDNYLRTLVMRGQLADNRFRGLLGVLLLQLARSDCQILAVHRLQLDSGGELSAASSTSQPLRPEELQARLRGADYAPEAVRIVFQRKGDGRTRRLEYVRLWISDELLRPGSRTAQFFDDLVPFSYLLKSASYYLHRPQAERLASYLATRSQSGIQDDSGVPFRILNQSGRRVQLFGRYQRATRLSDQPFSPDQPELRAAYAAAKPAPLPFDYGYGALSGNSNIQTTEQ